MNVIAWLMIMLGVWLIRSILKGQVQDSSGKFTLLDNLENTIIGVATGDKKLLKTLGEQPEAGITTRQEIPARQPNSSFAGTGGYPPEWDKLNPNTVPEAVEYALSRKTCQPNSCEKMVTLAYGYQGGYPTAKAHAQAMRLQGGEPPKGALVFWATRNPAGHVALSVGGGYVVSTDFDGVKHASGMQSSGPISAIDKWGQRTGWSPPIFRR